MRLFSRLVFLFVCIGLTGFFQAQAQPTTQEVSALLEAYRADANRLIETATADSASYERLAYMCDTFGPRLSGSANLENAIDWILAEMERDGLANVRGEPVMVPHWVRGDESLTLLEPYEGDLHILGLGGSIGTPPEGITGEVFVVGSFDELEEKKAQAEGKIVLFNVPFTNYGQTVQYRVLGAIRAAQAGAIASLIRSVGPFSLYTPHTGVMRYDEQVPQIPHAALTLEDAEMMQRMQDRGQTPVVRLYMEAETLPDAPSRNVVAEIVGSEFPDEVVVLGGHIDSWDVGQGAVDDGGGSVAAWEAVRIIKELGLQPRRTIRVVLWTNEENGLKGATAYRDAHLDEVSNHVLAMESDSGVFKPSGFGFTGTHDAYGIMQQIGSLLDPIEAGTITRGGGGADISPLMRLGVPVMGLSVEPSTYFWYHHTNADTIDKVDPHEMNLCVATMAVMAYVVADMPIDLPRARTDQGSN